MESAWKQLDQYIDLYKFYWGLVIKLNVFALGVAGAISSYVLGNQDADLIQYALLIPTGLNSFIAWLAFRSLPGMILVRDEVENIAGALDLKTYPEFRSLLSFMRATYALCGLTALGMLILFSVLLCS